MFDEDMRAQLKDTWLNLKTEFSGYWFDTHTALTNMLNSNGNTSGTIYLKNYKDSLSMASYHGFIAQEVKRIFKTEISDGKLIVGDKCISKNPVGNLSECTLWKWVK